METAGSLPCSQPPDTWPYPTPDQSSSRPFPSRFFKINSNNIHLRSGLPSGLFPSGFPAKTLWAPLLSPLRATSHSSWFDHPKSIWWVVQSMRLVAVTSPRLPYYLVPLKTVRYQNKRCAVLYRLHMMDRGTVTWLLFLWKHVHFVTAHECIVFWNVINNLILSRQQRLISF